MGLDCRGIGAGG